MIKSLYITFISSALFYSLFFTGIVHADSVIIDARGKLDNAARQTGIEQTSIESITGNILKTGLQAVGLIFFLLILYGGFSWMLARGSEDKITRAKNTVLASIIGLTIVLGAYAITAVASRLFE